MATVTIDSTLYRGVELYAQSHNKSVNQVIEESLAHLIGKFRSKQDVTKTAEFQEALSYVKSLQLKGGKPVPADEDGMSALIERKYQL